MTATRARAKIRSSPAFNVNVTFRPSERPCLTSAPNNIGIGPVPCHWTSSFSEHKYRPTPQQNGHYNISSPPTASPLSKISTTKAFPPFSCALDSARRDLIRPASREECATGLRRSIDCVDYSSFPTRHPNGNNFIGALISHIAISTLSMNKLFK
jgi:hypothetical protein